MTPQTPLSAFAPPLVSTLTLFLLFAYLHLVHRERYLALWTAAWGLWLLRLAYAALGPGLALGGHDAIPRLLAMTYTTLLLLGVAEFSGRRVAAVWLPLAVVAVAYRTLAPESADPLAPHQLFYVLVLGLGWAWASIMFGRSDPRLGLERWIPASALVLMGFHQWSIPIIQNSPSYTPWALSITLSLQIGIGVGVLVVFDRRARMRLVEAHEWLRIESYLMSRTDAQLSHGICPDCVERHFPGM